MPSCSRCPKRATKGLKTCWRCTKRLATYRARYQRNKRIDGAFAVSAGPTLKASGYVPIKDYPELGYDLSCWERDMRKLAAGLRTKAATGG